MKTYVINNAQDLLNVLLNLRDEGVDLAQIDVKYFYEDVESDCYCKTCTIEKLEFDIKRSEIVFL